MPISTEFSGHYSHMKCPRCACGIQSPKLCNWFRRWFICSITTDHFHWKCWNCGTHYVSPTGLGSKK